MKRKQLLFSLLLLIIVSNIVYSQNDGFKLTPLTVQKIMRNPDEWIGVSPSRIHFSEDGSKVYFYWNPEKAESDSLYYVPSSGGTPQKVSYSQRRSLPSQNGDYNQERIKKVYSRNGDLFVLNIKNGKEEQLTNTLETEHNPKFTGDGKKIVFQKDNDLYILYLSTGKLEQLTNFQKQSGRDVSDEFKHVQSEQDTWRSREALNLSRILSKRKRKQEVSKKNQKAEIPERPQRIIIGNKRGIGLQLTPDERFVIFSLMNLPNNIKRTKVPQYVTESGYIEELTSRSKVGTPYGWVELGIYDCEQDSVYYVSDEQIPGIYDQPPYLEEYTNKKKDQNKNKRSEEPEKKRKIVSENDKKSARKVSYSLPVWSEDGKYAAVEIHASDNKDRWIMQLITETGELRLLDRQHDEAWIGGPGIRSWYGRNQIGWMPNNRHLWFHSEESGYCHLYTVDVITGEKKALTSGEFEIYSPQMSHNEKYWYFTANKEHPGVRHFYRMPIKGGEMVRITSMTGNNDVTLSPDEEILAVRYSRSNRPWELYIMENKPGAEAEKITSSLSQEFLSYSWHKPDIITFFARDGSDVYARLYRPESPEPYGPAVIFVHGAGYMQNAHKWWSSYFREYMFHNLLTEHGYTVLDIDYRGSAGYGRDWRTAIYRHMGGKDLTDQVDGVKFLIKNYDMDPERIGIYGGSYGGFITLMAMFTVPDIFKAGAALRAVTDWAHYNHSYTSNILNTPVPDSLAYKRSSPIYFVEGLKGSLLMGHGMLDRNVQFQDIVRLTQRLIELGKENWELAVYPLEGHSFQEPSSWTDEYRRIFKLFEDNLK